MDLYGEERARTEPGFIDTLYASAVYHQEQSLPENNGCAPPHWVSFAVRDDGAASAYWRPPDGEHDSFRIEYRVDGMLAHSGSVSSPWALVDYSALPGNNVEFAVATICGTETSDPTTVAFIAEDIEKYHRKHVLTASISLSPESPVIVEAPRILSVQTTGASRWEFFVDDALVGKGDRNLQRAINLPACIADAGRFSVLRLVAYTPTSETSDRTTVSFPGCPVGQNVEPQLATVANNLRACLRSF